MFFPIIFSQITKIIKIDDLDSGQNTVDQREPAANFPGKDKSIFLPKQDVIAASVSNIRVEKKISFSHLLFRLRKKISSFLIRNTRRKNPMFDKMDEIGAGRVSKKGVFPVINRIKKIIDPIHKNNSWIFNTHFFISMFGKQDGFIASVDNLIALKLAVADR